MTGLRWRKFSPIDRRWPIFELVDGETILLDVTKNEEGTFDLAIHEGAAGRIINLLTLENMLAEAKELLEREEPD